MKSKMRKYRSKVIPRPIVKFLFKIFEQPMFITFYYVGYYLFIWYICSLIHSPWIIDILWIDDISLWIKIGSKICEKIFKYAEVLEMAQKVIEGGFKQSISRIEFLFEFWAISEFSVWKSELSRTLDSWKKSHAYASTWQHLLRWLFEPSQGPPRMTIYDQTA